MRGVAVRSVVAVALAGLAGLAATLSPREAAAIERSEVVARAKAWVEAAVPFCHAPNGAADPLCNATCTRPAMPAWDPYRSDGGGLVSWAWGLAAPGLAAQGLAAVAGEIQAADLKTGDLLAGETTALLFVEWLGGTSQAKVWQMGGCGAVAGEAVLEVTGVDGSIVKGAETLRAYRFLAITDDPTTCRRSGGGLVFGCDGAIEGLTCVQVGDPDDAASWGDDHLCTLGNLGMVWSSAGPVGGMRCTAVYDPDDAQAEAWKDNHVCLPNQAPVALAFSSKGPIEGQACVQWNDTTDPAWADDFLCASPVARFTNPPFTFSASGPVEGEVCVAIDEPDDRGGWPDNYLCTAIDYGLKWSSAGPVAGMTCVNVHQAADEQAVGWSNDHLCAPPQFPWVLSWYGDGAPEEASCVRWYEPNDVSGAWGDDWLCFEPVEDFSAGGFVFSNDGPEPSLACAALIEPDDGEGWVDAHVCGPADAGLAWSSTGPLEGMTCVGIREDEDDNAQAWKDNYLCVPPESPYRFTWSSSGPIAGKSCLRWMNHQETSPSWGDDWLCVEGQSAGGVGQTTGGVGGIETVEVPTGGFKGRDDVGRCSSAGAPSGGRRPGVWGLMGVTAGLVWASRTRRRARPKI